MLEGRKNQMCMLCGPWTRKTLTRSKIAGALGDTHTVCGQDPPLCTWCCACEMMKIGSWTQNGKRLLVKRCVLLLIKYINNNNSLHFYSAFQGTQWRFTHMEGFFCIHKIISVFGLGLNNMQKNKRIALILKDLSGNGNFCISFSEKKI